MFDPDDISTQNDEADELDRLLGRLSDCDLGDWDSDFVEDLTKRLIKSSPQILLRSLTTKQKEQLERMKVQYGLE